MKAQPFILTPSGHLYEADEAIQPATHYLYAADDHAKVKRLRDALELTALCLKWWHEFNERDATADKNALETADAALKESQ